MNTSTCKIVSVSFSFFLSTLSGLSFGYTPNLDTLLNFPTSEEESRLQSTLGSPLWTFKPLTATSISISNSTSATIQYEVTNQSRKSHTLVMQPVTGINQDTSMGSCSNPFTLGYLQSCILTLTINGGAFQNSYTGGPKVCQQGNALQCYQPSAADILKISVTSAPGSTTLSVNPSALGLSVNDTGLNAALTGTPRKITITNMGSNPATNVTYTPTPALPIGTSISPASCGTLSPASTCVLTITPGNTPSAPPGNTNPTPITLSISGTNTNTVTPTLNILTYGSVYQGGYLFSVNDTTPDTGSIGGSVVTLMDQAPAFPNGVVWSSNNANGASVSEDTIPLISEQVTAGDSYNTAQSDFNATYANENIFPFPAAGAFLSCTGNIEGACNSTNILTLYNTYITNFGIGGSPYTLALGPTNTSFYAAGLCTAVIDGYSDWHLPAICEMGPDSNSSGCTIGTQNILNQLPNLIGNPFAGSPTTSCVYGVNCLANYYWSSTQHSGFPRRFARVQYFDVGGGSIQSGAQKLNQCGVRCTRALTL